MATGCDGLRAGGGAAREGGILRTPLRHARCSNPSVLAFVWILTLLGLAVWSLLAWGLHAVLTIDPRWVDNVESLIHEVPYADLIDDWIPGWQQLVLVTMDLAQTVLSWVGSNAPLVAWIVWAIGALAILGTGLVLTLIVCLLREKKPQAASAH
jgi:hypothetical protein